MIKIEPTTYDAEPPYGFAFDPPYLNLMPIVDALVVRGNKTTQGGFVLTQGGGWLCQLDKPIDIEFVETEFELPPKISLSREEDSIFDFGSWCAIEGPDAPGRQHGK